MYQLTVKSHFSAAHRLVNYPGVCERIHGHNYKIWVTVSSETTDEHGMVVDLMQVKKHLDECTSRFDHRTLNEVEPFDKMNPTSEQLARYICEFMQERLSVTVEKVDVSEIDDFVVTYRPEK